MHMLTAMRKGELTTDFHTHILPGIDDGSQSVDVSIKMLDLLHKQGIERCVLTPHYYKTKESVENFIKRREESYEELKRSCNEDKTPLLALGAEVHLTHGLSNVDLSKLCMGNSNVVMVEFPPDKLQYWMMDEIEHIAYEQNVVPMIAHVDRLLARYKEDDLHQIFGFEEFIFQINNDALFHMKKRFALSKRYEDWHSYVLGSDTHGMSVRPPNFLKAMKKITAFPLPKGFKRNVVNTSAELCKSIFADKKTDKGTDQ